MRKQWQFIWLPSHTPKFPNSKPCMTGPCPSSLYVARLGPCCINPGSRIRTINQTWPVGGLGTAHPAYRAKSLSTMSLGSIELLVSLPLTTVQVVQGVISPTIRQNCKIEILMLNDQLLEVFVSGMMMCVIIRKGAFFANIGTRALISKYLKFRGIWEFDMP